MQDKGCLGVMLDCSRNAVMSVSALKGFIDKLEIMGYNTLMLYTEDTYEIEGEPLFGYMRGRYTKSEIKEIDEYCKIHGIELIPCIQTLAHLHQIFRHGKYNAVRDFEDILLCDCEETYQLIEKMIKTCAENFTTRQIHIGMDEANLLGRGRYLTINGYKEKPEIMKSHLDRVCKICEKYSLKPMMWADMFFRMLYGGSYYQTGKQMTEEIKQAVPENITLVYWDYYHDKEQEYLDFIRQHKALDRPVWFAGGFWKWTGFMTDNVKSVNFTEKAMKACDKEGVKNVFFTMWGDDGNECPAYATLPAMFYGAEAYRGNYDLESIKDKFYKTFGENWDDFFLCDLVVNPTEKRYIVGCKAMMYNDPLLGRFDSCVKEYTNAKRYYNKHAKLLLEAKGRSKNYSYIFDCYYRLCKLLSVKYDLGYRTRNAYLKGDKEGLKKISLDFKRCIRLLDDFINSFRIMWHTDNKTFGFEVQEMRLGALRLRLISSQQKIEQFLKGEIDKIEDFDEKLVDYYSGEDEFLAVVPKGAWYKGLIPLGRFM